MRQKGAQQGLVIADGEDGQVSLHSQVGELDRGEVGKGVRFGVAPDEFDVVEFRGVGRQQLGADAMAIVLMSAFDRFADMSSEPVPDQSDLHAQRGAQLPQKLNHVFAIETRVGQDVEVGAHATALRRDRQCADYRGFAPGAAALPQHWGVPARGPTAPHQRAHEATRFVYEDERRAAAPGVFSTRGQSCLIQRRISRSSRSTARRAASDGNKPSSSNASARKRRRSNSSGLPLGLIAHLRPGVQDTIYAGAISWCSVLERPRW